VIADIGRDRGSGALVAPDPDQAEGAHGAVDRPGGGLGHHGATQVGGHLPTSVEPLSAQLAYADAVTVHLGRPSDVTYGVDDLGIGHGPRRDRAAGVSPGPVGPRGDLATLLAQDPTDRLNRVAMASHDVDESHDQRLRGSSSPAKKTVADFKMALSSSSRRTLALSDLISASSSVVGPWRRPPSTSAWIAQRRTDSLPTPSCLATTAAAAVSEEYSPRWSWTSGTDSGLQLIGDQLAGDLRGIYSAPTVEAAWAAFEELEEKWGKPYPAIPKLWRAAWEEFTPFLAYDVEIRRVLFSTNAIESLNARYRRAVTVKGHFPTQQAALKTLNLVTRGMDPQGTGQARWTIRWKPALNAFAVTFADRMPAAENL